VGPATVWMVHRSTGQRGVQGQLFLDGDRLIFRPALGAVRIEHMGETVFGLEEVVGVSRARGSPVLELEVTTPGVPSPVLFYFVRPPDFYGTLLRDPRAAAGAYLAGANAVHGREVDDWVEALRRR
jgi:hypothetical protein